VRLDGQLRSLRPRREGSQGPVAATGRTGSRNDAARLTNQSNAAFPESVCERSAWEGTAATTPRRACPGCG
jgi:hypothetical protein